VVPLRHRRAQQTLDCDDGGIDGHTVEGMLAYATKPPCVTYEEACPQSNLQHGADK
jgi:hypothetical protein